MKFLFHLCRGKPWQDATHGETLACAEELARYCGGTTTEVTLIRRDNAGEPDPPFEMRAMEERAVVVENPNIEPLAAWAEYHDAVVQIVPCSQLQASSAGTLTCRLFVSTNEADDPEFTGEASA